MWQFDWQNGQFCRNLMLRFSTRLCSEREFVNDIVGIEVGEDTSRALVEVCERRVRTI